MKFFYFSKRTLVFFLAFLTFSCASRKEIVYYQNADELNFNTATSSYEIKIQPDDLLLIIVSAEDMEIAAPFNLNSVIVNGSNNDASSRQETLQQYLVDSNGYIYFPILGKIRVAGLSRSAVIELLSDKIGQYVKNPIVNLRVTNFKVAIQGEVVAPGTFTINSDRLTLIEALAKAGDLTIYGKRKDILIIREINGVKTFNRVDITQADFMNSPFYYLVQNDIVYVEPNRSRINGAAVGPNTGVIVSITSLLITLITLITR